MRFLVGFGLFLLLFSNIPSVNASVATQVQDIPTQYRGSGAHTQVFVSAATPREPIVVPALAVCNAHIAAAEDSYNLAAWLSQTPCPTLDLSVMSPNGHEPTIVVVDRVQGPMVKSAAFPQASFAKIRLGLPVANSQTPLVQAASLVHPEPEAPKDKFGFIKLLSAAAYHRGVIASARYALRC